MVLVRLAKRQDIPRILELYEELTEETQTLPEETVDRIWDKMASMPGHALVVAEEDSQVLATTLVQIVPNLSHDARPWAIIENVVVDHAQRRHGTGRIMMEYVVSLCRQAGCYKIQLMSQLKRREAHQFYRALGFQDSAVGFRLYL